jgi:hypothetical protein
MAASPGCTSWFPAVPRDAPEPPADVVLTGVELSHYRAGELAARATAARALYRRASGQAELEAPRARLPSGDVASAARAEWDGTAWRGGPVTVEGPGYATRAPQFTASKGRIHLEGGVRTELRP